MPPNPFSRLPARDPESKDWNVVIETPKGCRNKYKFDEKAGLFALGGVLPAGAVFPFDFGYVPATRGEDGDPLDVLILMDEPAFVGCVVPARLIGVIEAEQTERDGKRERNDRLIAVATNSHNHHNLRSLKDVADSLLDEIEHFFASYNQARGKRFKPLGRFGPGRAEKLVKQGMKANRSE
jgi:inorganic pyrophosphatase